MKPNFALSLSFEGIRLLHRAGAGWTLVGEVPLDSPDLTGELAVLRKTAVALDPAGLRTKIILPNDQIRYLAIDSTRATEDEIRARLQDATPYRLDELAWDVVRGGGRTYIAAVARETLDEAENFAVDHRFGPVSFTAVPEEFTYIGEPFLGQTRAAATLLPPGESVERDAVPVKLNATPARPARTDPTPPPQPPTVAGETVEVPVEIAGNAGPAEVAPPAAAATATEPALSPLAGADEQTPAAEAFAPAEDAPPVVTEVPAAPAPAEEASIAAPPADLATVPAPDDASAISVGDTASAEPARQPEDVAAPVPPWAAPVPEPEPEPKPETDVASEQEPKVEGDPSAVTSPTAASPAPAEASAGAADEAEATPVFSSRMRTRRPPAADPKDVPPAPPVATPVAPAARSPARTSGRGTDEPVFSRRTPPPVSVPAPPSPPLSAPAAAPPEPVLRAAPDSLSPVDHTVTAPTVTGRLSIDTVAPAPRPVSESVGPRITGVALTPVDRPTVVPFAPLRPGAPPPAPAATAAPASGARIAPFPPRTKTAEPSPDAARFAPGNAPSRGKPRFLGLILTLILIVLMVIVALWLGRTDNVVSRFFGGSEADPTAVAAAVPVAVPLVQPDPVVEDAAAPVLPAATETAAPEPAPATGDEELVAATVAPVAPDTGTGADLPDVVAAAAAAALVAEAMSAMTEDAAAEPATDTAATDPADLPAPGGEIVMVTPEEADEFYAATGVWLRAPRLTVTPQVDDLGALAVSSGDAAVTDRAGVTLPPLGPDPGLVAQANPPPAGTRLPRDDRGFILATPEGTVTPDGLIIFAGLPPVVPQVRPGTIAPEPAPEPDTAANAAPVADQPLATPPTVRPVARPGSVEALATEATEELPAETDAAAPGGVALTDLRPLPRPESVAALAPPPPLPGFEGPRPALRPEGLAPEGATSDIAEDAAAPVDPEAALAQTLASIVEGAGDPLATATPQAVAVARRPDARPSNFARVVAQQSERLARATEAAQQQAAPASLGTPEEAAETEVEEVEVAAAAPTAITPRSVSDAATMQNIMALREINLIGVYGTPNDRRALVRLANGRYVRVSVGDSLDGGQVAAISDNALNYIRRGRTITLEIPGE